MKQQPLVEPPSPNELTMLVEAARDARALAYAPYSHFAVGAAMLDEDGNLFTGCNIENASYGLTLCAERVALGKAVSEASRSFRAIAVVGPDDARPCYPCGACRQVLHELSPDLLIVTAVAPGQAPRVTALRDLLPLAFGPDSMSPSPTHG